MYVRHGAIVGAFLALAGCGGGGSGGSSSTPGPGPAQAVYKAWTAWIPDAAAADAAKADLIASNGLPGALWTGIDGGLTTKVFDPVSPPAAINAILIQVSAQENYSFDSVEILDAQDRVVEFASGTIWSNLVDLSTEVLGAPDGTGAQTQAAGDANAFIFTRYAGPIDQFRINARGDAQSPIGGDVLAAGGFTSNFNEVPGGVAVDQNGIVYLTLTVDKSIRLVQYGLDGAFVDDTTLEVGFSAVAGSHTVVVDKNGVIFTAATMGNGEIEVRKHAADLNEVWSVPFLSGLGGDRVEPNGLAVDGDGNVVVAGGMNTATGGINHWLAKVTGAGLVMWDYRTTFDKSAATYWRAVAVEGSGVHVYATGDLTTEVSNLVQMQTARFDSTAAPQWDDQFGGEDSLADAGNAVALDPDGGLVVAGFTGNATQGRNAILFRYGSTGIPLMYTTLNGVANGNDEILDIAVDEDGSIYAVGYETVTGQGENMWIRKYDANLAPIWTRTHHGGFGNDRAVSVAIHEDKLVVAGYETEAGGKTKLVLRVYAR